MAMLVIAAGAAWRVLAQPRNNLDTAFPVNGVGPSAFRRHGRLQIARAGMITHPSL